MRSLGPVILLALLVLRSAAPRSHAQEDITFTAQLDGSTQRYVELLPPNHRADTPADLVIALHGHGSDRWQFIQDSRGECKGVRDTAAKHGAIVVSPDYRAKTSWMGPAAEADVVQIIHEVRARRKIKRTIVAGGSMGGTSAIIFAALHPELVDGVCSLNGTANMVSYARFTDAISASYGGSVQSARPEYEKRSPELHPERLKMPCAFTTGGKDSVVPPDSTQRLVTALKSLDAKVFHIHRPEGGHATDLADTSAAMEFVFTPDKPPVIPASSALPSATPTSSPPQKPAQSVAPQPTPQSIPESLRTRLHTLKSSLLPATPTDDRAADAAVFLKAVDWAVSYENTLLPADITLLETFLHRFEQRSAAPSSTPAPWQTRKGKTLRGFISKVDHSIQPYGVIIPSGYDGKTPFRLDVVLHGSSKPVGMSEARFLRRFDEGDGSGTGPELPYLELHPLGRVENCYRWAGETDVFEAIEAVCRNYNVDRNKIVLRGMSMGASGTWHLGLKHPDRFAALAPYCGYVDTHRFSETPVPGFIKVGPLPDHQERALNMLDSIRFAGNARMVPVTGAIGDKDVFFQSHVHMGEVFREEGIEFVNLIAKGTGHTIDPATHKAQLERVSEHLMKGPSTDPDHVHFVTSTLKYARCRWLEVTGLDAHYERAEFIGSRSDNALEVNKVRNIREFAVHRPIEKIRIEGMDIPLKASPSSNGRTFRREGTKWLEVSASDRTSGFTKRPGLQGPIDDAFSGPFLCVRGTGAPWNKEIHEWADASLRRFAHEWRRYMRGDLPIKDDLNVTEADLRTRNLILFGDPGSNRWLAKMLTDLPLTWTPDRISMSGVSGAAKDHAAVLIHPNPLAPDRYVVINSGHTFHEAEFAAFNYLLFPRLGDRTIMRILPGARDWRIGKPLPEEALSPGFFGENWR